MSVLARLLVALASPIRRLDVRSARVERALALPLTEADVALVRQAGGRTPIGAYYHWYLQKLVVARAVRNLDRGRAASLVRALDRTDYAPLRAVIDSATGVLVAIPHHAHYVLSMTALAAKLARHRPVNVFYGRPATHRGNAVFDQLHAVLFSGVASGVHVLHDDRQGLARAIRALKAGEVVVIMPDVFQDEDATLMFPFCGRLMNAMLGTAALARRTGSWILPAVSRPHGGRLAFRTWFGERLEAPVETAGLSAGQARLQDYAVTRALFRQFERAMREELHLWQNVRGHMALGLNLPLAAKDELPHILEAIAAAPLFRQPDLVLDLD